MDCVDQFSACVCRGDAPGCPHTELLPIKEESRRLFSCALSFSPLLFLSSPDLLISRAMTKWGNSARMHCGVCGYHCFLRMAPSDLKPQSVQYLSLISLSPRPLSGLISFQVTGTGPLLCSCIEESVNNVQITQAGHRPPASLHAGMDERHLDRLSGPKTAVSPSLIRPSVATSITGKTHGHYIHARSLTVRRSASFYFSPRRKLHLVLNFTSGEMAI